MLRLLRPISSQHTHSCRQTVLRKRSSPSTRKVEEWRKGGVRRLSSSAPPELDSVACHALLLARTYEQVTGKQLMIGPGVTTAAEAHARLWTAPFCVLSHGTQPSPIMNYDNCEYYFIYNNYAKNNLNNFFNTYNNYCHNQN